MPYQDLRRRIRQHPGDDSRLRAMLDRRRERDRSTGQQQQDGGYGSPEPDYMPWSGGYETDVGRMGRDRDFEMASIAGDEQSVRRQYGFDDPTDPFSRSREIQRNFERQQAGTITNFANEGQIYSGALGTAQELDREGFLREQHQARTEYDEQLRALAERRLGAGRDYDEGVLAAEAQRLEDALQEPTDPMEAPPEEGGGDQYRRRRRRRR